MDENTSLVIRELQLAAKLMRLATVVWIARLQVGIHLPLKGLSKPIRARLRSEIDALVAEHRRLWRRRARLGGLDESVEYLRVIVQSKA